MQFDAALVNEQGVKFAVVMVKSHVFSSTTSKNEAIDSFYPHFGVPIIIARERGGSLEYFGRKNIVKFLSSVHSSQLPWKRYSG
jgi:hypothetical protein